MAESQGGHETLRALMDRTLQKAGLENTIDLLRRFLSQIDKAPRNPHVRKAMREVVTGSVLREFDIDPDRLHHGEAPEYKEARMVAFYLLFHHGNYSYRRIGEIFGNRPAHSVRYYADRCEHYLLVPAQYRLFCRRFKAAERDLFEFITPLPKNREQNGN